MKTKIIGSLVAISVILSLTVCIGVAKAQMSWREMIARFMAEIMVEKFEAELEQEFSLSEPEMTFGSDLGLVRKIEDYVPYVKFNQGIYTALSVNIAASSTLATTTISDGYGLRLGASSANLGTGTYAKRGTIYYNSTSGHVELYNGSSWGVIGTTTGWALSSNQVQMSDRTRTLFTVGTTTSVSASLMTIEATSTATIPLSLRGYQGQTANLFQIHNVSGTEQFAVNATGHASTTGMLTVTGARIDNGGWETHISTGSCNSASTTLFSVANPFGTAGTASSTASLKSLAFTGNSTTTLDLFVGTSTVSSIAEAGTQSGALVEANTLTTRLATSTLATYVSGVTTTGAGLRSSGSDSSIKILVGPSERITGFATTTGGTSACNTACGHLGADSDFACTYFISWER